MQPHELRVVNEVEDLQTKADALEAFISTNPMYRALERTDQRLLETQLQAQRTLIGILNMRIARFK